MSKVLVRVNSREITEQELNEMLKSYQQQTNKSEVSEEVRKNLLENLVENTLLQEEAEARKLVVTEELLNQQLNYFYQQFGGEENLKALLSQKNIKIDDIIQNIKTDLKGQLVAREEISKKMTISDSEMNSFYDENKDKIKSQELYRASHILFSSKEDNAKESALKILDKIKNSGDFGQLAKEHSSCPSKEKCGDLGFFAKGQMVPEFENAVVNMEIDGISDLVKTQFGYHIIKKTGYQESRNLSFDEAKDKIKSDIYRKKGQVIVAELIEDLRKKYDIEYA